MDKNQSQESETRHSYLSAVSPRTIEFCWRHDDGRIEVKYRRQEFTRQANQMVSDIDNLPKNSPYFYRYVG